MNRTHVKDLDFIRQSMLNHLDMKQQCQQDAFKAHRGINFKTILC